MQLMIQLAENGLFPDAITRLGIRRLLKQRLDAAPADEESRHRQNLALIQQLRNSPIALNTEEANEQHYEVPAEFFQLALGKHLKYSSALFPEPQSSLDQAEACMLNLTMERAQLADGQSILELGCGWGSLTLSMASAFPKSSITAVSNSNSQREFILQRCKERGLTNVNIITCDINHFQTHQQFDRVVSVEMFEHMRNYEHLMASISHWLKPDGKLFVHIFCHKDHAYLFETEGSDNWMGRYFFTGGIMPSDHLLLYFQDHMVIDQHHRVNGTHYMRTADAWLANMDRHKKRIREIFAEVYGERKAAVWVGRWRMFFMACSELFGYDNGNEWWVSHYLFKKRQPA